VVLAQPELSSSTSRAGAATATAVAPVKQKAAVSRRMLQLTAGGVSLPHPSKAQTGGEDAFFVTAAGCGALGVADGVGSWSKDGVDPAAYASGLMEACEQALEESRGKRSALDTLDFAQVSVTPPLSPRTPVDKQTHGGLWTGIGGSRSRVL
jgi:protein phosphatase PTC7